MDPAAAALNRIAAIQRLQRLTRLLDTRWTIPGTNWRFGLDPLLGVIPGVGDVITLAVSIYMLALARKIGAPGSLLMAMIGNVVLDFLVGEIPVVGDVFDFAFKAHVRNLSLLEKWLSRAAPPLPISRLSPPKYDAGMQTTNGVIGVLGAAAIMLLASCESEQAHREFIAAKGAIGPYSGSVIADDLCFVSGKIAPNAAASGAFADEVSAAIDAVRDELAISGLTIGDIVSVTAYLTDMGQFAEFNRIYAERFAQPYPARTTVGVASLPAGRRVEIAVIALRRGE